MKNYEEKYFSILGDSISTFDGCSQPDNASFYDTAIKLASGVITPAYTWWGHVIKELGGKLLVNNSISGSTVCWNPIYEYPSYGCSDERTSSLGRNEVSPDVIMVYIGTNDWGRGTAIKYDERYVSVKEKNSLFFSAYDAMLEKLRKNYPSAEIWCFTLSTSRCSAKESFSFPYRYSGRHIEEYCDAIRACAQNRGCRVVDLYALRIFYDTIDGFHPNAEGMKQISTAVLDELKNNGQTNRISSTKKGLSH